MEKEFRASTPPLADIPKEDFELKTLAALACRVTPSSVVEPA